MKALCRIRVVVLLALLMTPAVAPAQFTFITNNGAITITKYTGSGGNVIIPSTTNSFPVTSIGYTAFYDCDNLTSATIPNSVTSIGEEAFEECYNLTNVTIGNSVTNIGNSAFYFCFSLTSIMVDTNNPSYSSIAGVLFNKSQTALIAYPAGLSGSYTISNSVISIGYKAFFYCLNLTSVTIPNSVSSIGDGAFQGCHSLTNVIIPNSVTSIGFGVFYHCTNMASVTIPSSVTSIGSSAFWDCYSLARVAIPNGVTNIGDGALGGCSRLFSIVVDTNNSSYSSLAGILFNKSQTTLIAYPSVRGVYTIPNGVTSIGSDAFSDCYNLTSVTIPNSVTSIGTEAFFDCYSLTNVAISNSVTNIASVAFENCTNLTGVTIPNSVTTIGFGVFYYCTSLTNVTIGDSVTSIGPYAFSGCTKLPKAYFSGNAPSGDNTIFSGESGKAYYLPGTTGWGSTFGGWPTALWYQPNPMILGSGYGLGATTNGFGFTISWATNVTVIIEASTNLGNPVWMPVATNPLVAGTSYFSDLNWTNYPSRFYRIRSQ